MLNVKQKQMSPSHSFAKNDLHLKFISKIFLVKRGISFLKMVRLDCGIITRCGVFCASLIHTQPHHLNLVDLNM